MIRILVEGEGGGQGGSRGMVHFPGNLSIGGQIYPDWYQHCLQLSQV